MNMQFVKFDRSASRVYTHTYGTTARFYEFRRFVYANFRLACYSTLLARRATQLVMPRRHAYE